MNIHVPKNNNIIETPKPSGSKSQITVTALDEVIETVEEFANPGRSGSTKPIVGEIAVERSKLPSGSRKTISNEASESEDSEEDIEQFNRDGPNRLSMSLPQPEETISFLVNPQPVIDYLGFNNDTEIAPVQIAHVPCACPCLEILKQIQQGKFNFFV